jgi:hypothetical protein
METAVPDTQLEFELQELYILCKHWMQDLAFVEDELRFFKNILQKYEAMGAKNDQPSECAQFSAKIQKLEGHLLTLKKSVPEYLNLLKPFINDLKKEIHLDIVLKYNALQTEIQNLFWISKKLKSELFAYTEAIIDADKLNSL